MGLIGRFRTWDVGGAGAARAAGSCVPEQPLADEAITIIAGGTLVTGGRDPAFIEDGAVAIGDGVIREVGPRAEIDERFRARVRLDAAGKLVMPGLINAHTHAYSALARGIAVDLAPSTNFVEILEHLWWRLDRALEPADTRVSASVVAIDSIRNGTTTIVDHHASQVAVGDSLSEVAAALDAVGIRANLCFEVTDRDGADKREEGLRENERFAAWAAGAATDLLTASVGLHASFTLDDATIERAVGIARDHGIGCHVHAAEDRADVEDSLKRSGKRVVERLESLGALGPRTLAAHCIHIDGRERALLRETGTCVAHNPQSNMNNAVGCADVPCLLDEGVLVGLGSDGFSASMFDEAKVANLIHRHEAADPRVGHDVAMRLLLGGNPTIASRLCGRAIGVLEPGSAADVIVLDYDPPTPYVEGNFGGHFVFGLTGWMVETVIVGGRIVMRDREILTVDAGEVAAEARERARSLWGRM
jgi:putative selenium metabolism protein SsnA